MEDFCKKKFELMSNAALEINKCNTPLGFCQIHCGKLSFYKTTSSQCLTKCLNNYEIYVAVQEQLKLKKVHDPCIELLPKVKFETFTKIDYAPNTRCNGIKYSDPEAKRE